MDEKICYISTAHNLDRLRRVFLQVHRENQRQKSHLVNAIRYELAREGLQFKSGKEINTSVDFHVYEPFVADIIIGRWHVTPVLFQKFPTPCPGDTPALTVVVLRGGTKLSVKSAQRVDLLYVYGEYDG